LFDDATDVELEPVRWAVYLGLEKKPPREEVMQVRAIAALLSGLVFPTLAAAEDTRLVVLPDQVA
jgi:hypothetical protein